ncbi:MAG TPA: hypothetical protein VFI56_10595, partial [Vicinamibacterales bacterium]|nr:hypothetical protein [Vicinamibacterales bacterium]
WDKSNTFWESPSYSILRNIEDGSDVKRNRLVVRALRETDLRELWLNTVLECADSIMQTTGDSTWLLSEVTRISDQIRAANNSDPSREVYTNADFEESIRFLSNWAQTRSDIVRAQVAADRAKRGVK